MGQLYVEPWAPDYGSPYEALDRVDDQRVDETVETSHPWRPIDARDDGIDRVVFVDGVRRVDARLTLDSEYGPVPGLCGSLGVGAVLWDRQTPRSEVIRADVERVAVFGEGWGVPMPPVGPQLSYRTESVTDADPGALIQHFHGLMRRAEARLSEEIAQQGLFVVADGPINDLSATEKVGYIKTHRVRYLSDQNAKTIAELARAQRTPLFLIGAGGAYPKYSWYLRLTDRGRGHSWSGVVRAEVSSHIELGLARTLADRATALLPLVASLAHVDPRAPQNLVPIGALERELRRRLGDPAFVYRQVSAAVSRATTSAVA